MAGVRAVEVNGHQIHYRGWFHGWAEVGGETQAIVEREDGDVRYVDPSMLKFLKPGKVPEPWGPELPPATPT